MELNFTREFNEHTQKEYLIAKSEFALVDQRGRRVGYRFVVSERAEGGFQAYPHQLRDGETFGAIPQGFCGKTEEDAVQWCRVQLAKRAKDYANHKDFSPV